MSAQKKSDVQTGRFLSLVLRHKPEEIGLTIDRNGGWADTRELIEKVSAAGYELDMETLERIVRENNKQRYSFNEDKSRIRANQGHSIDVVIDMQIKDPPARLYHGTGSQFLESIRREGILHMSRQYVHLSADPETAFNVGSRHTRRSGAAVVLVIDTAKMAEDGYVFRISDNGVWQSADIPWKYVCEIIENDGKEVD
ncbi:MAG: RNA 2'-phosphotransferase [Ruminococcus sp.]|nr:RNA 2'-phosphotransferase [Ruminococcus sp.]